MHKSRETYSSNLLMIYSAKTSPKYCAISSRSDESKKSKIVTGTKITTTHIPLLLFIYSLLSFTYNKCLPALIILTLSFIRQCSVLFNLSSKRSAVVGLNSTLRGSTLGRKQESTD